MSNPVRNSAGDSCRRRRDGCLSGNKQPEPARQRVVGLGDRRGANVGLTDGATPRIHATGAGVSAAVN